MISTASILTDHHSILPSRWIKAALEAVCCLMVVINCDARSHDQHHQLTARVQAKFQKDVVDVLLDRAFPQAQLLRNAFIWKAAADERRDLLLTARQEPRWLEFTRRHGPPLRTPGPITSNHSEDFASARWPTHPRTWRFPDKIVVGRITVIGERLSSL